MQKKLLSETLNERPAELDLLHQRILSEIKAMGYDINSQSCDNGFILNISRDIGGIDTFLGRWQYSRIKIYCSDNAINMDVIGRDRIDKVVCTVIGPLFLAIPWIFGLIARSNRRNIEQVVRKLVADHATKIRLADRRN